FVAGPLQELRHWGRILREVQLDQLHGARPILDGHGVAGLEQHTGDVASPAVHGDVTVADQLAGAGAGPGPPEPADHVGEAALHDAQQHFAGVFRRARGQLEIASKLAFEDAVEAFEFLFLAQTDAVLTGLAAAHAVHARGRLPAFDSAFGAFAAGAFK